MPWKHELLLHGLREELERLQTTGETKLPSETELATAYHVSRQTVRLALDQLVAEKRIEKRRGSGSYLIQNGMADFKQIAFVATYVDDYIFPAILRDIKKALQDTHYGVSIYATNNSVYEERNILTELCHRPVAGIIMEGTRTALPNPNLELFEQVRKQTPMVFLHGYHPSLHQPLWVMDDNEGGGYQLTQYLLSQGYDAIGGMFKSDDIQGRLRFAGCQGALKDSNLLQPDHHFGWYTTEEHQGLLHGQETGFLDVFLNRILKTCRAVVCYNDEIAYHLIKRLQAMGVSVPEQMAVVSFDNSYYSRLSAIPITSLHHDGGAMGTIGAQKLLQQIQEKKPTSQTLSWHLIQRESG